MSADANRDALFNASDVFNVASVQCRLKFTRENVAAMRDSAAAIVEAAERIAGLSAEETLRVDRKVKKIRARYAKRAR